MVPVAILAGVLTGTFFMAFHSAQGPQLGLPQMIQSRPQFGYIGALLVWLFAYLQYAGFNVFNTILAGQAANQTVGTGREARDRRRDRVRGRDRADRLRLHPPRRARADVHVPRHLRRLHDRRDRDAPPARRRARPGKFDAVPFLTQFGVTAGYQISWAIYVSDYSRYLPPDVTVRRTFWWTYWGSGLGALWLMGIGALLAASAGDAFDTVKSIDAAANGIFDGFGTIVLLFSAVGLISVTALNLYGGSLTLISAMDSLRRVRPTLSVRVTTIGFTAALSLVVALLSSESFLSNFEAFLLLILYLFIPWTAINLIDYYVVRRGHYAVEEIFKPNGIYGRWGWRGIVAYAVGFACMVPFFSTPTFTGPIAKRSTGRTCRCSSGCRSRPGCTCGSPGRSTSRPSGGSPSGRPRSSRSWRPSTRMPTASV